MNSFSGYPLLDARVVSRNRERFRRDATPLLARANSLCVPTGKHPARGWLLLRREDYDKLNRYSTSHVLHAGDPAAQHNVGALGGLAIVQAQCVTRGVAADPNAVYLVEVTDARGVLSSEWSQWPLVASYNIRAQAYPDTFHTDSMNSGTTWTWSTMLQDIWERMSPLGSWPGLPYAPAGTPEGFWFPGVPALSALCDVLTHLGMTIACDLTSANRYTIVDDGANDSALTALQNTYADRLEDDQEWIDVGSGRVPGTVRVLFRRRNEVYGTEETVRRDSLQWSTDTVHSVAVAAPAFFAGAVGEHHIWSDFTVRYDHNGQPLAADVATAEAIASQRTSQYFDAIYSRTSGAMSQVYAGALPFTTGSQVDWVCWDHGRDGGGWRTRIGREVAMPAHVTARC